LELAQLSPLPPQDSVSTNFTTTADFCMFILREEPCGICFLNSFAFYSGKTLPPGLKAKLQPIIW
ncbi:MAG: hypothetical protein K2Q97_03155, partial [Burkholderiaceae bacterium]|nr:hypothetical protein [Burkholderiaceae bacterium]